LKERQKRLIEKKRTWARGKQKAGCAKRDVGVEHGYKNEGYTIMMRFLMTRGNVGQILWDVKNRGVRLVWRVLKGDTFPGQEENRKRLNL